MVDDIKPDVLRVSDIHQVLKHLLAERVPITNLVRIIESLLQHAASVKDPLRLADLARGALGREILDRFRDERGAVHAIVFEPKLETRLRESISDGMLAMNAESLEKLIARLNEWRQMSVARDQEIVLLVDSALRRIVRTAVERAIPELVVVAYSEVPKDLQIEFRNMLRLEEVFPIKEQPSEESAYAAKINALSAA